MTRRINILAVALAVLLVPSMVFAANLHNFGVANATSAADNEIVVPLEITNQHNLTALDIPLTFSEGVILKEVNFEGTRVAYFDFKIATIDNEARTVLIGLLPQMSPDPKPDLEAGTGTIANLVFEVTDPATTEVTIEATVFDEPYHTLTFVYHDFDNDGERNIRMEKLDMPATTLSLSGLSTAAGELPTEFALAQNYPNPFNPSTILKFNLPVASQVNLDIYNVLGQRVTTLVDARLEAGEHQYEWDGSSSSTGVYFYRIQTENNVETKKMILLK